LVEKLVGSLERKKDGKKVEKKGWKLVVVLVDKLEY
jgi:hypothetical protein